ncbi:MAG: hypothetical protein EOP04_31435 [Proteobacteria bacterium]|nr:MAG: hypothetical protein EOP04_31435 [Pseudomonadota bacterium]
MRKSLTAIGGSPGFIIEKPIAELYQLDKNTQIEVTPRENGLDIRFIKEISTTDEVIDTARKINKRYSKMMKNLAK